MRLYICTIPTLYRMWQRDHNYRTEPDRYTQHRDWILHPRSIGGHY